MTELLITCGIHKIPVEENMETPFWLLMLTRQGEMNKIRKGGCSQERNLEYN